MNREQIELLFCVLAFAWITYMAIKHKVHQTDRGGFRLILLIFVGLLLAFLCFLIPGGEKYTFALIGTTLGSAFVCVSWSHIRSVKQCSEQVTGIYQGFNSYSGGKGSQSHAPVFRYQYNGKKFLRQCASTYPLSLLEKRMKPGEEYTIYIDPKKPTNFLLQKAGRSRIHPFFLFGILIHLCRLIRTDGIKTKGQPLF